MFARHQLSATVSESAAARLWPGQTAIGKRLTRYDASVAAPRLEWLTVVGVVADVHPILRPMPRHRWSMWRSRSNGTPMLGESSPGQSRCHRASWARSHKRSGPRILMPMSIASGGCRRSLGRCFPRRTAAGILTASGLIGLLLAAIGLYAVVSQSTAQRTRELSIRMALGADRWAITTLVLREGLVVLACGAAIGVPLALVALRATATLVGPLPVGDPIVFIVGQIVVASATLLACYGPARRAASADPLSAAQPLTLVDSVASRALRLRHLPVRRHRVDSLRQDLRQLLREVLHQRPVFADSCCSSSGPSPCCTSPGEIG